MKKMILAGLSALTLTAAIAGGPVKAKAKKQTPKQEQCCDNSQCCKKGQQPSCCH